MEPTVNCPNCNTPAYLFDWGVRCTACGSDVSRGEAFPTAQAVTNNPPAEPPVEAPAAFEFPVAPTSASPQQQLGRQSSIHRRAYPALAIIRGAIYCLVGLIALAFLLECGVVMYALTEGAKLPFFNDLVSGAMTLLTTSFILKAILSVVLLAIAELIRVVVDIQDDTHESTQLIRHQLAA